MEHDRRKHIGNGDVASTLLRRPSFSAWLRIPKKCDPVLWQCPRCRAAIAGHTETSTHVVRKGKRYHSEHACLDRLPQEFYLPEKYDASTVNNKNRAVNWAVHRITTGQTNGRKVTRFDGARLWNNKRGCLCVCMQCRRGGAWAHVTGYMCVRRPNRAQARADDLKRRIQDGDFSDEDKAKLRFKGNFILGTSDEDVCTGMTQRAETTWRRTTGSHSGRNGGR